MSTVKILFLFGLTSSGKTTIGRSVSSLLKCKFIDLDEKIAELANMSVRSFYREYGRVEFQKKECDALKTVLFLSERDEGGIKTTFFVISAGGGLVENEEAIKCLTSFLKYKSMNIFFLDVPAKFLWKRLLKREGKEKILPAFLKKDNDLSLVSKKIKSFALYRSRFLLICKKRIILLKKIRETLPFIKVKCKGKKIKQIARTVIKEVQNITN